MAHRERRVVSATPIVDDSLMQDDLPRRFWIRVLNYAELDDFGTKFDKGAFGEYLARRMPRFLYGHNWGDPTALVGKGIESRTAHEGLDIRFELDDFNYVPVARQIAYQVKNGTLDQFSVDFVRQLDRRDAQGVVWITKARLPAVSGVPEGAVPGTKVLTRAVGLAKPGATISLSDALNVLSHLALGEIDLPDALSQLKEASSIEVEEDFDDEGNDPDKEGVEEEPDEAGDQEPPEGAPVVEEDIEATQGASTAKEPTPVNGDGKEAKAEELPAPVDDAEELALADEALALLDSRY